MRICQLAAIYLAHVPGYGHRVSVTCDLAVSVTVLRRAIADVAVIGAFWTHSLGAARRVVEAAHNTSRDAAPVIVNRIEQAAAELDVSLTEHALVMIRVEQAAAYVNDMIEAAQKRGELRWFNQAYRGWRRAGNVLAYPAARARLQAQLMQCAMAGDLRKPSAEILPLVLPGFGKS